MRLFQAGILFLLLLFPAFAAAQVTGEVQIIGFRNEYRAGTWTPMLVRLRPTTSQAATYQIRVHQPDMDGDNVSYIREISLTGLIEGAPNSREQDFWTYFIPKATREGGYEFGLPTELAALNTQLRVTVTTTDGEFVAALPIKSVAAPVDPYTDANTSDPMRARGTKMVLAVSGVNDTLSSIVWNDYQRAFGLLENVRFINITTAELPENVIGYDAVDAVVLLNIDPNELRFPSADRFESLRRYVRGGGKLVVTQPVQWERTLGLADLMPVTFPTFGQHPRGMFDRQSPEPLRSIARSQSFPEDPWLLDNEPYRVALAAPKPGAIVAETMTWDVPGLPRETPYIVRMVYGLGNVTWIAQDLSDRHVTQVKTGWPFIWDKVLDLSNQTSIPDPSAPDNAPADPNATTYGPSYGVDIGPVLLTQMEHGSRSASLIFIAGAFFVLYWLFAGPVAYLVLAQQKRGRLNWFIFALVAIVATVFTLGIVQLVLRGAPQLRHLTIIRAQADGVATVQSRLGLYIPSNGIQEIELANGASDTENFISPYPQHPQHMQGDSQFIDTLSYDISVPDMNASSAETVYIPYRSTLKKLAATWHGNVGGGIYGRAALRDASIGRLDAELTNNSGYDLSDVYFAYTATTPSGQLVDYLQYIPIWRNGEHLDTNKIQWHFLGSEGNLNALPGSGKAIADVLCTPTGQEAGWTRLSWYRSLRTRSNWNLATAMSLPAESYLALCLFDRLPPIRNERVGDFSRSEIGRRGARHVDMSPVISAGQLAIFARTESQPLPYPLKVNGTAVAGEGTILYQTVITLDRTTRPTTQPVAATQPAQPDP